MFLRFALRKKRGKREAAKPRFLVLRRRTLTVGAALLAAAAMIAILRSLGMYVPPAGALAILPMLLPAERLPRYPLQIALGTALFLALALVLFRAPRESHAER